MVAHTPGPWRMDSMANYIWADRSDGGEFMVAQIRGWGHLTGAGGLRLSDEDAVKVQEANGRLLAAAPDLLAALKELFRTYKELADSGDCGRWSLEDTDDGKQALAAIVKAEGA